MLARPPLAFVCTSGWKNVFVAEKRITKVAAAAAAAAAAAEGGGEES